MLERLDGGELKKVQQFINGLKAYASCMLSCRHGDEVVVIGEEGHSGILRDTQGHSGTLRDTQGYSGTLRDTHRECPCECPSMRQPSTAFVRWIAKRGL